MSVSCYADHSVTADTHRFRPPHPSRAACPQLTSLASVDYRALAREGHAVSVVESDEDVSGYTEPDPRVEQDRSRETTLQWPPQFQRRVMLAEHFEEMWLRQ